PSERLSAERPSVGRPTPGSPRIPGRSGSSGVTSGPFGAGAGGRLSAGGGSGDGAEGGASGGGSSFGPSGDGGSPIGRNGGKSSIGEPCTASVMNLCHTSPGRLLPWMGRPRAVRMGEFLSVPIHTAAV